jgi:hypothetical protein
LNSDFFLILIGSHLLGVSVVVLLTVQLRREFWPLAISALASVVGISLFTVLKKSGADIILEIAGDLSPRVVVSSGLGFVLAAPWLAIIGTQQKVSIRRGIVLILVFVPPAVLLGLAALLWRPLDTAGIGATRTAHPEFVIEEVYKFEADPIRVSVDENSSASS